MAKPNDDTKLKGIKTAQDRKDFAIAFYNATNNAIELVKSTVVFEITKPEEIQKDIEYWRDWFLAQHLEYRAKVTEKIGASYDPKDALDRLKNTKNLKELEEVWRMLSEDERRDEIIHKECQELKDKYETIS